MIELVEKVLEKYGLVREVEEEFDDIMGAFRAFAINFDVKPFLELIRRLKPDTEGFKELLEELDVDTCEPDFVLFFLSDVYEEMDSKERLEELLKLDKPKAAAGVALLTMLYKVFGSREGVEEALRKLLEF